MIVIYRHPEGISLNGKEYLLNDDNTLMKFETEELARDFLYSKDYDEWDINESVFIEDEEPEFDSAGFDKKGNNHFKPNRV